MPGERSLVAGWLGGPGCPLWGYRGGLATGSCSHSTHRIASCRVLIKNFVEPTQQNTLGMVMIQKFAPAKNGKRDETEIQ